MLTRRQFLVTSALTGTSLLIPATWTQRRAAARNADMQLPPGWLENLTPDAILDPTTIPKYETQLIAPPAMPRSARFRCRVAAMLTSTRLPCGSLPSTSCR